MKDDEKTKTQEPTGPTDIAEAFQILKQQQQGNSGSAVGGTEEPEHPDVTAGEPGSDEEAEDGVEPEENQGEPEEREASEDDITGSRGSTNDVQTYDYSARRNGLINDIQQQSIKDVTKMFEENDVKMWSMQELYHRDEDGTVHFDNPDSPGREFASRAEAQSWIESMNAEIQNAFANEVRKRQQELYKKAEPSIRLLEFAPAYDAMDDDTKAVFNELTMPYSVYDDNGNIIGFSCNLNAVANQAANIAGKFSSKTVETTSVPDKPAKKGSDDLPDMDPVTSSGAAGNEKIDPKNIEEAMAILNKRKEQ